MIQDNWKNLKKADIKVVSGRDSKRFATIIARPLERGFGITLGNALRRVLLSSLQGAAVTAIKIDGVLHEFSSLKGVREDVTDIVLNIKQMAISLHNDGPKHMTLKAEGPGQITAGQIKLPADIEILNPELVICTLDDGALISIEFTVDSGFGYVPAERERSEETPLGVIQLDALFSPVRKVAYRVEKTREGQNLELDQLVMDIETNGTIEPEYAVAVSSKIIQDQLQRFITFDTPRGDVVEGEVKEAQFNRNLLRKVDELELSVRSANCLKNDNIIYIGDLIMKTEGDMLRTPNFGRKSLNEIKAVLTQMELYLGMDVPGWPPENIELLVKRLEDNNY